MTAEEWGIPTLDLAMQARDSDLPVRWTKWGTVARTRVGIDGYHFYAADYKFAALWKSPEKVIESGARLAVEVNYSVLEGWPAALAMQGVYRKRTMAKLWQEGGVRVLVDLLMPREMAEVALLGVPEGWGAYATRKCFGEPVSALDLDYEVAEGRCGGPPGLFVVFGGGKQVRDHCLGRGWSWVNEQARAARGLEFRNRRSR